MLTCIYTYIHKYKHTYILHTYINYTYIHVYIHTHICPRQAGPPPRKKRRPAGPAAVFLSASLFAGALVCSSVCLYGAPVCLSVWRESDRAALCLSVCCEGTDCDPARAVCLSLRQCLSPRRHNLYRARRCCILYVCLYRCLLWMFHCC